MRLQVEGHGAGELCRRGQAEARPLSLARRICAVEPVEELGGIDGLGVFNEIGDGEDRSRIVTTSQTYRGRAGAVTQRIHHKVLDNAAQRLSIGVDDGGGFGPLDAWFPAECLDSG